MGAYIINVPDTVDTIIYVNIGDVYDGKTYIASQRVEDLTPYTEPDLEQVRKEAYEAGAKSSAVVITDDKAHEAYKLGYENGLNDAWEAARTLWNTPNRKEIFGHTTFNTVLTTLTAQETIEKIRQYEQEKDRQARIEYNFDEIKDVLETTAKECNVSLDEIAEVLAKMKEA